MGSTGLGFFFFFFLISLRLRLSPLAFLVAFLPCCGEGFMSMKLFFIVCVGMLSHPASQPALSLWEVHTYVSCLVEGEDFIGTLI